MEEVLNWMPPASMTDEQVIATCEGLMVFFTQSEYPAEYAHFDSIRSQALV